MKGCGCVTREVRIRKENQSNFLYIVLSYAAWDIIYINHFFFYAGAQESPYKWDEEAHTVGRVAKGSSLGSRMILGAANLDTTLEDLENRVFSLF